MKATKFLAILVALAIVGVGDAAAHGPRTRIGVYVGPPVVWGPTWGPAWSPYWYPPPYYYPPQQVIVVPPSQPPVYIEQNPPAEQQPAQQYWHYCKSAKGYYPYVKECPEGWQRVLPQPEK